MAREKTTGGPALLAPAVTPLDASAQHAPAGPQGTVADPGAGRLRRGRYYRPCAPVLPAEGVAYKRTRRQSQCDVYDGEGSALIAAGVVTADLLPPLGMMALSWRPADAKRELVSGYREPLPFLPGYMRIERRGNGFRVYVTVSREEQVRRKAEQETERARRCAATDQARRELADRAGEAHKLPRGRLVPTGGGHLALVHCAPPSLADHRRRKAAAAQAADHAATKHRHQRAMEVLIGMHRDMLDQLVESVVLAARGADGSVKLFALGKAQGEPEEALMLATRLQHRAAALLDGQETGGR